jgi:regulatory protein
MDDPSQPGHPLTIVSCAPVARGQAWQLVLSDGSEVRFTAEACRREQVEAGMVVADGLLERLEQTDREVLVHEAALRLLSHRARSASEMRTRLAMRGFAEDVITHELERLSNAGLLDDPAFARSWVADRQLHAPRGRRLLRYELLSKGIDPDSAEAAVDEVDDAAVALELARKRARRLASADEATFRAKLGAYLQRRGISYEPASSAIAAAWDELQHAPAANEPVP